MFSIRPYRVADTPQIMSLFHDTVHSINARDYSQEQVSAWAPAEMDLASWTESLGRRQTFVAEESGGEIVGFGELEQDGHIHRFYVHKDRQRHGIGSALLSAIEHAAGARGLPTLSTDASITARRFFEQAGFRIQREQTVHLRDQQFVNYRMEKPLPDKSRASLTDGA
jgi:ribosomal protein S18 acetylase RimI-like enzyme